MAAISTAFHRHQALCDLRAARHRHRGAGARRGRQRAPARGADRRVRSGLAGLAERRAHQRPDLRGGDGIARRLHVDGHRRPAKKYADGLLKFNDQIAPDRQRLASARSRPDDAAQFSRSPSASAQFIEFRKELARLGTEVGPAAGREWGDNDANRTVRTALNKDLETLGALYSRQARDTYAKIDAGIDFTAWLMSVLGALARPARRGRRADPPARGGRGRSPRSRA